LRLAKTAGFSGGFLLADGVAGCDGLQTVCLFFALSVWILLRRSLIVVFEQPSAACTQGAKGLVT